MSDPTRTAFNAGYVLACCNIAALHNSEEIACDVLAELGIREAELAAMDLTEFDAEQMAKIRAARGPKNDPIRT